MKAARFSVELDGDPTADGKQAVRLVISQYGRARVRIGLKVHPSTWDSRKQRVKLGAHEHLLVNARIGAAIAKAQRIEHEQPHLDAKGIKAAMEAKAAPAMSFAQLMLLDFEETPPANPTTALNRKTVIRKFTAWDPTITVREVTTVTMERWLNHLKKTVSHNTAAAQVVKVGTIYKRCCKRLGLPPISVTEGIGAVERYTKAPSQLTPKEVAALARYADKETGWNAKAVHMWLFGFYSLGMRWSDLCNLQRENIAGGRVTLYSQGKTDVYKSAPLQPVAKVIAGMYVQGPYIFGINGPEPPTLQHIRNANSNANRCLKIAAKACGISKRMHTHNNRHTYAGLARVEKVDDRTIAKSMGISERMVRQHYRGEVDQKAVDQAARDVFRKMGK